MGCVELEENECLIVRPPKQRLVVEANYSWFFDKVEFIYPSGFHICISRIDH